MILLLSLTGCTIDKEKTAAEVYLENHTDEEILVYFEDAFLLYQDFADPKEISTAKLGKFAFFHAKDSWYAENKQMFYIALADIYEILDTYLLDYYFQPDWFEEDYDADNEQIVVGAIGMGTGNTELDLVSAEIRRHFIMSAKVNYRFLMVLFLTGMFVMLPYSVEAADNAPQFIINGYIYRGDWEVVNGVTYMKVDSQQDFTYSSEIIGQTIYCSWDNSAKAVIFIREDGSRLAQFPIDSNNAWVDGQKLSISNAPVVKNGGVWLPLRSVAEAISLRVEWLPRENCIVMWTPLGNSIAITDSETLAAARQAAITAPRICLHEQFQHKGENPKAFTYTFPRGRSDLFCYTYGNIKTAYVVRYGAAWAVWQSQTEDGTLPKEWGDKPDLGEWQAWFFDYPFTDMVRYGFIENGLLAELGEFEVTNSAGKICEIPGEIIR